MSNLQVKDSFFKCQLELNDYLKSIGIDLSEYHLVKTSIKFSPKHLEIIYHRFNCMVAKFNGRYIIRLFNKFYNCYDETITYLVVSQDEMPNIYQISKELRKTQQKLINVISINKLGGNGGWICANTAKVKKYKPLISENYLEFVKKHKIISSYKSLGVSFNTNMLLNGPPGTGKTRFIMDIAVHLEYPIYNLRLSKNDIGQVSHFTNCIFMIEEIDKEMSHDGSFIDPLRVDESQLLCFLDGNLRSPSTILVMTCNDLDKVKRNKVFSRKGRINKIYHFGKVTFEQCEHLINMYYKNTISDEQIRQFFDALPKKPMITIAILSAFIQENILNEVAFADLDIKSMINEEAKSYYLYN